MRTKSADTIALLVIPLLIAAFRVEDVIFPAICMTLVGAIVVFVIASHDELTWRHRVAICTVVFTMDLGLMVYLFRVNLARELREQVAPLAAATLPSPVSENCPIPAGAVALYLGNRVAVITEFPHVVFKVHDDDVFVIDREPDGLLISLKEFDDAGNIVVRLEKNQFVAMNLASRIWRPDRSTMALFDPRNNKILEVQYLNPQAIKVTGILRYPGAEPIIIAEKYVGMGGGIVPPECTTGLEAEFKIK